MSDTNDALKQKLLESLNFVSDELIEGYKAGKAFVIEQAPEVVQELVRWGIVKNAAQMLGCLAIIIPWCLFFNWARKKNDENQRNWDDDNVSFPLAISGFIVLMIPTVGFCASTINFLQALVAPRLFLIHQASQMLK